MMLITSGIHTMRAQRLSASKIGSLFAVVPLLAYSHRCSTPVGVKDRFTWHTALDAVKRWVLNACRRQRSVHRMPWRRPSRPCSAQRLSASKIGSPEVAPDLVERHDVLNACRRQRSVHDVTHYRLVSDRRVLNACRRQRSVHAEKAQGYYVEFKCSTPVGVKDRFTVLRGLVEQLADRCSTPVGVKDRFTFLYHKALHGEPQCSTPVGVKDRFT